MIKLHTQDTRILLGAKMKRVWNVIICLGINGAETYVFK